MAIDLSGQSWFFHAQKAGEVKPLEECLPDFKPVAPEQVQVLLKLVGNQDIFQRFPFARDLGIGVSLAALEVVVEIDEKAVDVAIVGENFLGDDQGAVGAPVSRKCDGSDCRVPEGE